MGFLSPQVNTPAPVQLPNQPLPPPMFGAANTPGQKPKAKPSQPTFLGSGLAASGDNLGYKTLLGGGAAT